MTADAQAISPALALIIGICTIAGSAAVNGIVSLIIRASFVSVREDNVKLRQEMDSLKDGRIKALEAKDERDITSRARMHDDMEKMGTALATIKSEMQRIPTVEVIRSEIDRSIRAGEERVNRIESQIRDMQDAHVSDTRTISERVAGLEARS